ncbi:MAG: hypothetical protein Ct9H300mP19_00740 [Dehalococcoidia bacterium]|nr:MAG: hypothetical protein Ct9H300mP19_00740 [Dehalococcoidia bacterium]
MAFPEITNGHGPDVIIETAGAPGTALNAAQWVRKGGRAVIVGFSHQDQTLNFGRAHQGEKTVIASSATSTGGYRKAVDLIAQGAVNVKPLISALVPLDRGIEDGFERMLNQIKTSHRIFGRKWLVNPIHNQLTDKQSPIFTNYRKARVTKMPATLRTAPANP